jgi:hypothetical protein
MGKEGKEWVDVGERVGNERVGKEWVGGMDYVGEGGGCWSVLGVR